MTMPPRWWMRSAFPTAIEIRQDTRGVPGLHAQRRHGARRETLELIYQEN